MTKWIVFLLSATILSAANPDSKTEKDVLAALDAYKQAMIKRDSTVLAKVLGDDLIYTHSSTQHQNKAEVLKALKGDSFVESMSFKDLKVRVYGNTAVVTADVDIQNNAGGNVTLVKLNVLHVFVKGSQGWQMVARQATRVPDPAAEKE